MLTTSRIFRNREKDMRKSRLNTVMCWLRRKYPKSEHEVTVYNIFAAAFEEHFGTFDEHSKERMQFDLLAFENRGVTPVYVDRFIRRLCAQYFTCASPAKGGVSCESGKQS